MTREELLKHGYTIRLGFGAWTVFYSKDRSQLGAGWRMRKIIAQGKIKEVTRDHTENALDRAALKAAIGAACADLVKKRVS